MALTSLGGEWYITPSARIRVRAGAVRVWIRRLRRHAPRGRRVRGIRRRKNRRADARNGGSADRGCVCQKFELILRGEGPGCRAGCCGAAIYIVNKPDKYGTTESALCA